MQASICGYAGGKASEAGYYTVATGATRHAEAAQVAFDPSVISKETIPDIFFLIHDPATKDR